MRKKSLRYLSVSIRYLFYFILSSSIAQINPEQYPKESISKKIIEFKDDYGNTTNLPMILIRGSDRGKILTILAGVHGYEYPPIIAVQEFLKEVNPKKLKGTLLILPMSNPDAFYARSLSINPKDSVNLNNAFPGKDHGTVTEQIAYYITKNIIPITDIFLDIHSGDANEDLAPFVCYYDHIGKPQQTKLAKELSEASGFTTVVSYPYTLKDTDPAKYAFKQAVQDGKVGLSFEAGRLGNVQEEAVALNKNGIYHVMHQLNMYESVLDLPKKIKKYNNQVYIKVPMHGIFYSDFRAGEAVTKDQEIGYISNEFGEVVKRMYAPISGTILYKISTPPVNPGETLMCIGLKEE